jgi:hypothetical protein
MVQFLDVQQQQVQKAESVPQIKESASSLAALEG